MGNNVFSVDSTSKVGEQVHLFGFLTTFRLPFVAYVSCMFDMYIWQLIYHKNIKEKQHKPSESSDLSDPEENYAVSLLTFLAISGVRCIPVIFAKSRIMLENKSAYVMVTNNQ